MLTEEEREEIRKRQQGSKSFLGRDLDKGASCRGNQNLVSNEQGSLIFRGVKQRKQYTFR